MKGNWFINIQQPYDGKDCLANETTILYNNWDLDAAIEMYKEALKDKDFYPYNPEELKIESGTALFVYPHHSEGDCFIEMYYGGNGPVPGEWLRRKYDPRKEFDWGHDGPWWMLLFGLEIPDKYKQMYERSDKAWKNWDVEKSLIGI